MKSLTREQHAKLAASLKSAADSLTAATRIVRRAPFTDRVLYVQGSLQEWLIDPFRLIWDAETPDKNPYPSVGYGGPHRRKPVPEDRL